MPTGYTYHDLAGIFRGAHDLITEFRTIEEDLFLLKPDPESWSAAEICSHLLRFNTLYIREMEKAPAQSLPSGRSDAVFKPGFLFRKYAAYLEPPYTLKLKTLKPFYPVADLPDRDELIGRLAGNQSRLAGMITGFRDHHVDLKRSKGKNPVLKFIRMSLIDYLVLLDAHQRRHFWQLDQTLRKLGGNPVLKNE